MKVKFADFEQRTRSRSFGVPVGRQDLLRQAGVELIRTLLPPVKGVRLLGVTVSNFDDGGRALPLFDLHVPVGAPRGERSLMPHRGGSADLPLHGGRVPRWLGERMTRLGAVISEAIVHEYGRDELLRRLAHPFWYKVSPAGMRRPALA